MTKHTAPAAHGATRRAIAPLATVATTAAILVVGPGAAVAQAGMTLNHNETLRHPR